VDGGLQTAALAGSSSVASWLTGLATSSPRAIPAPDPNGRRMTSPAEAERARTPRTALLALTGVWLAVAAVVLIVLAVALTLYLAYGGS
jgi:hypothetical protein